MIYFVNGKLRFSSDEIDRKADEIKQETKPKREREVAA